MAIELPSSEFEILRNNEDELKLYDKVVDKIYTLTKRPVVKWHFPVGSRQDIINHILGAKLFE